MKCPKCSQDNKVKNGIKYGRQRYNCRNCGCHYIRDKLRGASLGRKLEELSGMHTKKYVAYALGIAKDVYFDIEARQPELIEAYDRGRYKLDEFAFNRMRENIKRGCTQSIHLYLKTKGG